MLQELRKKDIKLSIQSVEALRLVLNGLILLLFIAGVAALYWNLLPPRKDLYNELWGPAYLLVRGQSPYNTASLNPVLPAAWLPMAIGFFAPLGWLAENTALYVWFLLSLVEVAVMLLFLRRGYNSIPGFILVSALAFSFPALIHHLILGQFSLTTTICVIAGTYFLLKERDWIGSFFLALGLTKLHLMTLPLLGLSTYFFRRSGWRQMVLFWTRLGTACLVLSLPLFIAYPNWIPDAIRSMASNAPWAFPTLQKFLTLNFGALGMALWVIAVGIVIFLSIFIWRRLEPAHATYWNLGLALLISPYIGSWDFVTLLPLIVYTFLAASIKQKIFYIASYLTAWILMARIQLVAGSDNYYFWWVPLWHLLALAIITPWQNTSSPAQPISNDTRPH